MITVGALENGILEIVQGVPPTLALIWTKILLTIDLRPFPYRVFAQIHCVGTPLSYTVNYLISLYPNPPFFGPERIKTQN